MYRTSYNTVIAYYENCNPNSPQIVFQMRVLWLMNMQCDFADGVYDCQTLCRVPMINWRTQPQIFKKLKEQLFVKYKKLVLQNTVTSGRICVKNYHLSLLWNHWLEHVEWIVGRKN